MTGNDIVVIAIDGLRASALGAYGNTWYSTPGFDKFAAESFLAEWCFAPSSDLAAIYRALWLGAHPLRPDSHVTSQVSLASWMADHGYTTHLITDEPALLNLPGFVDFGACDQFTQDASKPASDLEQTSLARLLAVSLDWLADEADDRRDRRPSLTWIHARGLYGVWDAPIEWRAALVEEGDPPALDGVDTPDVCWTDSPDPDEVFPYSCGYAAQIKVLDTCISALLAKAHTAADATIVVIGVRGFPLGEHGRVGGVDGHLFAEQLQVPLMIRFPTHHGQLRRSQQLTEHTDLMPTLAAAVVPVNRLQADGHDMLALASGGIGSWRDRLVAASPAGWRTIRTTNWCWHCRRSRFEDEITGDLHESSALFVRPDDRWEANDVADLRPQIAEDLSAVLADFEQQAEKEELLTLAPLPPALLHRPA